MFNIEQEQLNFNQYISTEYTLAHQIRNQVEQNQFISKYIFLKMGCKNMIYQLNQLIRSLDIFGAPLQLAIQSKETQIQSFLGGLSTIIIYSTSAAYFVYVIYTWNMKQILPTINTQNISKKNGDYFPLDYHFFSFSMFLTDVSKENEKKLRSGFLFNQTAFYYPDYNHFLPTTPNKDGFSCGRAESDIYYFSSICMNLDSPGIYRIKIVDQNHLYQDASATNDTYLMYQITFCNKTTQPGCLSFEEIFESSKRAEDSWELSLVKQDVNIETGEIFKYRQNYYYWIGSDTSKFLNLQLVITRAQVTIDDGFIFPNTKTINIISDITFMATQDESFFPNQGPLISVSLDKYTKVVQITYPKITEVLASGMGFFQTLILTGFLINLLNSHSLSKYLQDSLVKIYFPSLSRFKIEKDWKGKVKHVTYKDNVVENITALQIEQFTQRIEDLILNKLNILNILAEINKLQIAIQVISRKNLDIIKMDYRPSFEHKLLKDYDLDKRTNIILDETDFFSYFKNNQSESAYISQIIPENTPIVMDLSFNSKCLEEKSGKNKMNYLDMQGSPHQEKGESDSTLKIIYEG